jgi:coenzyme F420-reducing hydrogenase gamma subunit
MVDLVARPPARPAAVHHPRVGVVKFASCDGCQLTLLDLEDELLAVTEKFEIVEFAEATSNRSAGPFDVLFVEGSISTPEQAEEIVHLREASTLLVTIGACATAGGIQALRNLGDHDAFRAAVYPHPEYVSSLATSLPVSEYVKVDAELRGCPIDPGQLLEVLTALAMGRRPQLPNEAVCLECKRRGAVCVVVARGMPCLGPVTRTGCGALCPAFGRGCYGCFGPRESANAAGLASHYLRAGDRAEEVGRRFAGFTVNQEPFRSVVVAMDRLHGAHGTREGDGR